MHGRFGPPGHHRNNSGGSFFNGAMLGVIVGAILGVLYAPAKGEETRKKVKEEAEKMKARMEPVIKDVKEKAGPMAADLRPKAEPYVNKAKEAINEKIEEMEDESDLDNKKRTKKGYFKQ